MGLPDFLKRKKSRPRKLYFPLDLRMDMITSIVNYYDPKKYHIQYIFAFENGLGASVLKSPTSFGGSNNFWQVTLIRICGDGSWIEYEDVTCNPIGWLTDDRVIDQLYRIRGMKDPRKEWVDEL